MVAAYLSPEWFDEMQAAASAHTTTASAKKVSLRETIKDTPFGDVSYVMTIGDDGIDIDTSSEEVADVTFTQDYETATALHRQETTTQEVFFAGKVKVSGHLNALLDNSDLLQGVAPVFADVRERTTYS